MGMPRYGWVVERIVFFEPNAFIVDGLSHFGFRDAEGRLLAIDHRRHRMALVGDDGGIVWTAAPEPFLDGVPNVRVALRFPMYSDVLPDGAFVVSNFGDTRMYRIDPDRMTADLLVDGSTLGMKDMGNCVVDAEGFVWVNEVTGHRVHRFDPSGAQALVLGDGRPGFQRGPVPLEDARFGRVYDLRRGSGGRLFVLDSGNFAVRVIDLDERCVGTVAGTGEPGYSGDGGDARRATFGSDPTARFDGPISLAVDSAGTVFVGDRFNHVVRMIDAASGVITTIAGCPDPGSDANDTSEREPLRLRLPKISSMDLFEDTLFVPTDLDGGAGDLAVLRSTPFTGRRVAATPALADGATGPFGMGVPGPSAPEPPGGPH